MLATCLPVHTMGKSTRYVVSILLVFCRGYCNNSLSLSPNFICVFLLRYFIEPGYELWNGFNV